jgi:hypothetical protein
LEEIAIPGILLFKYSLISPELMSLKNVEKLVEK